MKSKNSKLIKFDSVNDKHKDMVSSAAAKGDISAWIKNPLTQELIRVHPDIVKRMKDGESISVAEILKKSFSIINH